ncbi:DUF3757 domain-containing protein [Fluviispira sanaruensis]|uniref:DUF3757 domain-containing protein n=1 Tax=Fluviispira sanaruensis TaxID=2493639 RepID=A0A4V0P2S6_FLUSA|nr:DUF3757 domain-containing protein [Fluviispira sanaruensis]BBH54257.1 hypothetical protein JCM31447_27210 [Fluviispira sanaruensis]
MIIKYSFCFLALAISCYSYAYSAKSCPEIIQLKNYNNRVFSTESGEWFGVANNSALNVRIEKFDSAIFRPSAVIRVLNTNATVPIGENFKCSYILSDNNLLDVYYESNQTKYRKLLNIQSWQSTELFGTTYYECKSTPHQCQFVDIDTPVVKSSFN